MKKISNVIFSNESKPIWEFDMVKSLFDFKDNVNFDELYELVKKNLKFQGNVGECLAATISLYVSIWVYKLTGEWIEFSDDWLYLLREKEDWQGEGLILQQVLNILFKYGIPPKKYYDNHKKYSDFLKDGDVIPPEAFEEAKKYRFAYYSIDPTNVKQIQESIFATGGLIVCYTLTESFYNGRVNGVFPKPIKGEKVVGGHGLLAFGVNVGFQRMIDANHWGKNWDDDGVVETSLLNSPREAAVIVPIQEDEKLVFKVYCNKFKVDENVEISVNAINNLAKLVKGVTVEKIDGFYYIDAGTFESKEEAIKKLLDIERQDTYISNAFTIVGHIVKKDFVVEPPKTDPVEPITPKEYEIGKYNVMLRCDGKYKSDNQVEQAIKEIEKELKFVCGRTKVKYNNKYLAVLLQSFDNKKDQDKLYEDIKKFNKNARRSEKVEYSKWTF